MKKILLLDDDLDILQVIEALFIMEQFEVKITNTCNNFIELVLDTRPDAIILDYCLADGNGGELCRQIKAHPVLKDTPVIILSAYMQPGLNFMACGCDEFIAKPFNIEDLVTAVDRLTKVRKNYSFEMKSRTGLGTGKNSATQSR